MIASPETYKDVRKYFEGTVLVCPEYNPNTALCLESAGPEGMRVYDVDGQKGLIDYSDQPYNIQSPLSLRRQWYNSAYVGQAAMIQRIPARMWRKGICDENTHIMGFSTTGFGAKMASPKLPTVQDFLTNKENFPTVLNENTIDGRHSVALSEQWALFVDKNTLFLYHAPVATISIPKKMVSMLKEFSQLGLPKVFDEWTVKYV
jgi:hypothetical protein